MPVKQNRFPFRLAALATCAALGLSACTTAFGNTDSVSVVPLPAVLDQGAVQNLVVTQVSTASAENPEASGYAAIDGNDQFNELLATGATVEDEEYGPKGDAAPEVNTTWSLPTAAGKVLAERLTTTQIDSDGKKTVTTSTLYANVATKKGFKSGQLLAKDSLPEMTEKMVQALDEAGKLEIKGRKGKESVGTVAVTPRFFNDVVLDGDGALTVVLAPGLLTSPTGDLVGVQFQGPSVKKMLSPAGAEIQKELLAGEKFVGLPKPPKPKVVRPPADQAGPPVDCNKEKCVALTFDDGPGPFTNKLLDDLAAEGVKATFFLVGRSVAANPTLVSREVSEGHAVGGHSWDHPDLRKLPPAKITEQLTSANDAIKKASGITPTFYRPTFGAVNPKVREISKQQGQAMIMWDVDTQDWSNKDVKLMTEIALRDAKPGSIILMHDIHATSVEAVPGIVKGLKAKGFRLVTIPQLLGTKLEPGAKYFSRTEKS